MTATQAESYTFQAEVGRVLELVVNSLYTHREVFLRELLSNASDALDHLSFRSITEPDVMGEDRELGIRIAADEDAATLTISDNGVGMTREQLVENLGTIAQSGTRGIAEAVAKSDSDASLIGQFGVGFYSAFLVAERVTVVSRAAGSDEVWQWESDAKSGFTVEQAQRGGRGTDVVLHLRDDDETKSFLREWTLRDLVRKYSDYVRHPILLRTEKTTGEEDDAETVVEWDKVNQGAALWTRPKSEITDEQYRDFYKHLTRDWEPPLAHRHFKVEGVQELKGILFVPARAPFDMGMRERRGIRLFVRRVFIMDDCEELLPEWLRFVRGVVDSDDLPLNVSREFLQKDRTTAAIRKQVIRHALNLLEELAKEEAPAAADEDEGSGEESDGEGDREGGAESEGVRPYETFWRLYGAVLKEGVHYEPSQRDRLAKLLRYETSRDRGLVSLEEYVEAMEDGQENIYHVTASSRAAAAGSPHIEALRERGYEVLYMTDPVDEWVVESLSEFRDVKLVSAAKGALDLPESDEAKKEREEQSEELSTLSERMQSVLSERVKEVRVSSRLTDSPACLVVDEHGMAPHVERMLRATQGDVPMQQRILEVNPTHPVIAHMRALAESGDDAQEGTINEWSRLLLDQALIAEGSPPSDPAGFARRITTLFEKAIS